MWTLPVGFVLVPDLTTERVARFLGHWTVPTVLRGPCRPLHACLVAHGGKGLIFIRADDPPNEQRFSAAHELGHFLIDYLEPRRRALKLLGDQVVDVLDGRRAPSRQERIDGLLGGVPLGVYTHLFARGGDGSYSLGTELAAESRADLLALVLLAPPDEVRRRVHRRDASHDADLRAIAREVLQTEFGLPTGPARFYADLLFGGQRPSVRRWLGLQ